MAENAASLTGVEIKPERSTADKLQSTLSFVSMVVLTAGCMVFEPASWSPDAAASPWAPGNVPGVPKLFAGVLLVNFVGSTLILVFVLSFGYAGAAREKYGFPLPTMYAATDIYMLDVESKGQLLGGGEAAAAERLDTATVYNCHQRAHQQPLETYTSFIILSYRPQAIHRCAVIPSPFSANTGCFLLCFSRLLSGIRYPALTTVFGTYSGNIAGIQTLQFTPGLQAGLGQFLTDAFSGVGIMWCISRVVWARGYATGKPEDRYRTANKIFQSSSGFLKSCIFNRSNLHCCGRFCRASI